MYYLRDINLQFGDRIMLNNISFMINPNDKIGLIGRNGCGKTTLFNILSGDLMPDAGKVELPKECKVIQLRQFLPDDKGQNILQEAMSVFKSYNQKNTRILELEEKLTDTTLDEKEINKLLHELTDLQDQVALMFDFNPLAETEKILKGLGISQEQFKNPIGTLSGGKQMRIEIAKCLLQRPDILLLDEPTNHLDIESIIWFEQYIKEYPKCIILVSHDEEFLNNSVNRILHLENQSITDYKGSYSKYLDYKVMKDEQNQSAFTNQQKVIKEKERTITRFMAKATKTKMAQSMKKQLDKMDRVELNSHDNSMINLNFPYSGRSVKSVLKADQVDKSYGDQIVLSKIDFELERNEKVAFVGQNGKGKSTLLKALISEIPISGGHVKVGDNVTIGYYAQDQSDTLDSKLTVLETIERTAHPDYYTSSRKILGSLLFSGEDVDKKVSVLSGGEKARLALACMVANPSNLLVFDEPTNHLDIQAKKILKEAILSFEGSVVVVSHDRSFLTGMSERTIEFRGDDLKEHLGDIQYVLAKRKTDDFREFSMAEKATKVEEKKDTLSYDERKKLQRRLSYVERDIEKLESEIASIQEEMMDPAFYEKPESTAKMASIKEKKKTIEKKMEEWEVLSKDLED